MHYSFIWGKDGSHVQAGRVREVEVQPRRQTPGLEPGDKVAGAVGGRKSPGDGTGRGGGPAETQATVLRQAASHSALLLPLPFWTRPAPPPLTLGAISCYLGPKVRWGIWFRWLPSPS